MTIDDLLDRLQSLDFTEYQARAYVAAVQLGSASPTDLAEQSEVPQSRIYDVIDDLQKYGVVEIREESKGKVVYAPEPEQMLETLKERRVTNLIETIDAAASGLDQLHRPSEPTEQFVSMVQLQQSALRHIRRTIEAADWWLSLALPLPVFREVEEDIETALGRGVNVRLVTPANGDSQVADLTEFPDGLQVKKRLLADTLALADRTYGVFSSIERGETGAYIVIQEENLVFLLQHYFEHFWPVSAEIQAATQYPRRYLDPWRAIKDLKPLLDDESVEFEVSITGYHNELERLGSWQGTLVDYELSGPVDGDYTISLPTKANLYVEVDGERLGVGGPRAPRMELAAEGLEFTRR